MAMTLALAGPPPPHVRVVHPSLSFLVEFTQFGGVTIYVFDANIWMFLMSPDDHKNNTYQELFLASDNNGCPRW